MGWRLWYLSRRGPWDGQVWAPGQINAWLEKLKVEQAEVTKVKKL